MRSLSLVVIGLTLAATTAAAEPLRLADTDLDRITTDVGNTSIVARIVEALDYDGLDTDNAIIRILGDTGNDTDIAFMDVRSTADPEHDGVDHALPISDVRTTAPIRAVRVSNDDAGNAVGGSGRFILRNDDLAGIGVVMFDRGAVASNETPAAGTRTADRQIVVRTSSTDNRAVVQTTGSLARAGRSDSSSGVSSGVSSGGVQRSILVRTSDTGSAGGIRASSLFAGNGNAGLSTSRLDSGITAGGFGASAFAGGSVTSMLGSGFN